MVQQKTEKVLLVLEQKNEEKHEMCLYVFRFLEGGLQSGVHPGRSWIRIL